MYFNDLKQQFSELQRRFDEIISELPAYGGTLARIKVSHTIASCNGTIYHQLGAYLTTTLFTNG